MAMPVYLEFEQRVLHEFDGSHIKALAGLHDDENVRPAFDFARQDDFLLIAAGEKARRLLRRPRADIVTFDEMRGVSRDMTKIENAALRHRRSVKIAQHQICSDRIVQYESRALAVFRHEAEASFLRALTLRLSIVVPSADMLPLIERAQAGDHLAELALSIAIDAADAMDFTGAHIERQTVERPHAAVVGGHKIVELKPFSPGMAARRSILMTISRPTILRASSRGVVPAASISSLTLPNRMTVTRSATFITSSSLWVMNRMV